MIIFYFLLGFCQIICALKKRYIDEQSSTVFHDQLLSDCYVCVIACYFEVICLVTLVSKAFLDFIPLIVTTVFIFLRHMR